MNLTLSAAQGLMQLATWIVPPSRDGWQAAMRGEFAAIENSGQALSWSAGCLAAALGWRLTAEAPLIAGAVAASLAVKAIYVLWFFTTDVSTVAWMTRSAWLLSGLIALSCALLTTMNPRRKWLIGLAFPLVYDGGQWAAFMLTPIWTTPLAWQGNNPPLPAIFLLLPGFAWQMAPGLFGALAAGGLVRTISRGCTQTSR